MGGAKIWQAQRKLAQMIHDGFQECMRVLDDYSTLIFKWSECKYRFRCVKGYWSGAAFRTS